MKVTSQYKQTLMSVASTIGTLAAGYFISQHKQTLISIASSALDMGYSAVVPTLILASVSAGIACFSKVKIITSLKEKMINNIYAIGGYFNKQTMPKQLGFIVLGETLGYLCGVPMPLLTAFPFIVAPKLLQPIINYSYLTIPLGYMAYQINKNPEQYLAGHLLNLAAIGGLFLGKKIISAKIAASSSVNRKKLSDLNNRLDGNSQHSHSQKPNQINLEEKPKAILVQSNAKRKKVSGDNVPYVSLKYILENVSDDDSEEDSDYTPPAFKKKS